MSDSRYKSAMEEYIRIKDPDYKKLSELVIAAKGDNRSLTEFSKACNTSVSTLSRLVNQKVRKHNSDELIIEICKNATKDSCVTIDNLMKAYGKIKLDNHGFKDTKKVEQALASRKKTINERFRLQMNSIIEKNLLYSQKNCQYEIDETCDKYDFCINCKDASIKQWAFYYVSADTNISNKIDNLFARLYAKSAYDEGKKISLIMNDKKKYEKALEITRDIKIYDEVSFILVNFKDKSVVDETKIKRRDFAMQSRKALHVHN